MEGLFRLYHKVYKASGVYLEAYNTEGAVGDHVVIYPQRNKPIEGEIIGFSEDRCIIMPFSLAHGVKAGDKAWIRKEHVSTVVGEGLLGELLDPFGRRLVDGSLPKGEKKPILLEDINPLEREKIGDVFDCGIRSINALLTLGKGQKVGIFAGAGVGKSTLLGMIVKNSKVDAVVLALIGERGREVREFVEDVLGEEGRKKSIIVVTTSDQTPILKVKGAISSLVHARYLASKGMHVLLVMDSITRLAMAQREVGLSAGEPPTMKGYTPSVFYLLSKVVENCGNFKKGSITGIFSVLVEGDDISLDPVADSLMGVLDGHIILSRKRANAGIYPAIDPVRSLSRLMPQVVSKEHMQRAMYIREVLSAYESLEDMVYLGLYTQGSNPLVDKVVKNQEGIREFFRQGVEQKVSYEESLQALKALYEKLL
ncbi:FliI/YscN family ATPase [Hydrogenobacter sp. T-2]|uniref:FliI/YscN family ATPase n=1 Tax=Pampinifervens diazotrophicum TaxID=1632018 RepID=UPI002B25FEAB|nr:FliI/YscN family ATPase [Hydrogenobacter sp. T-2]WPM33029.1 FliI/YscN family ATPase [Hydrogenobacter sp. T-2]